jgi:hypothetical protein
MNCVFESRKITPILAVSLLLAASVLAWGQKKTSSAPAPKAAPAQHTSTQHTSTPHTSAPSHSAGQSRTTTPSHSTTGSSRPTGGTRPTSSASRPTTGNNRPTTTGGNRPNTTGGNRPTVGGNRPTTGGNRPAPGGNRGPSTASRGPVSRTPPGRTVSLRGGGSANIRPNGSIRSIDRNGMHIEHGAVGGRTVVTTRNGATIVSHGRGGYVQRAYVTRGGVSYVSRTYVYGGVAHVGVYRSYYWGGHAYYGWHPGFFWHPGFYAWAWNPWPGPLYWGVGLWGWGGAPWWGFYGGWWNPYPYYAAPAFWLTDYLIASELQAAYAARQEARADEAAADAQASASDGGGGDAQAAPAPASGQVTLTPEVKEAIAEEVKAQIAAQQAQAQQSGASAGSAPAPAPAANNVASSGQVPPALDPAQRTFVVDTPVTGVTASGQECGLTAGDVVTRLTDTPDSNNMVSASISATKQGDCGSGQTVSVKVDDLQEMYNHFADQLQNGMSEMAKKQGTNGMPKAPDTGTTASDVPPPKPDPSAAQDLQQQQAQADQTEAQVKQETAQGGGQ